MSSIYATISILDSNSRVSFSDNRARTLGRCLLGNPDVGTTEESIDISSFDSAGSCVLRNNDDTNYVDIGLTTTGNYQIRLYPLQSAYLQLNPAIDTIYLKANTADCNVTYIAWELET